MQRRKFIKSSLVLGAGLGWQQSLPAWAQSPESRSAGLPALSGSNFELTVSETTRQVAGKAARHIRINDQFPAPLLRWREGDELTLTVRNTLSESTSIHWHGILLPWQMDGVPGVSYAGIGPGQSFSYRFPVRQSGTYWYHSHSGLQEQLGHYGPLVIDPAEPEPFVQDREYVVMLSDWTFEKPERVFSKLKKMSDNYNFQKRTLGEFFHDVGEEGLDAVLAERMMWGDMRMSPTDLSDVTAATYTYLVNGHSPAENWTGLFRPGETVRLRFINASAMSIFNVRIPGLAMTVVAADGQLIEPVETDEFQIGTAETFDVLVRPTEDRAYTLMAETNDFFGYARATLAPRPGMSATVPALRERPLLSMKDMGMAMDHGGMDHGSMGDAAMQQNAMDHEGMNHEGMNHEGMNHEGMNHEGMNHEGMNHEGMNHEGMNHEGMNHEGMNHEGMNHEGMNHEGMNHEGMSHEGMNHAGPAQGEGMQMSSVEHRHPRGPGVVNVAENPVSRLHERPLGLGDEPHRVLVYTDLRRAADNPAYRRPDRELELHLTSNMERYVWAFDGRKFSEVSGPIPLLLGERVRLSFVNDTMMPHPLHLHGMFFEVVNGHGARQPHKHTLVLKPGEKASVDVEVNEPGPWAFHCHLLYHMHAGMMRVFFAGTREQLS